MVRLWKIYLVTNDINNKVYVGQTVRTIEERWQQHCNDAAMKRDSFKFHKAIRLLGSKHFTVKLLEICGTKADADRREQYYIAKYDSYVNGYNSTPGGATLPKINNTVPVCCVDTKTRRVIDLYNSIDEASIRTGVSASAISHACHIFKTAGGFYWCFNTDYQLLKEHEAVTCNGKRYIVKIDIETKSCLEEWLGVDEASAATGMSASFIGRLCNNKAFLQDATFVIRWKADWVKEREILKRNPFLYKPFWVMKLDPKTMYVWEVYKNSYVACEEFGVQRNTLEKCVDVPGKLWRGYYWCTCRNREVYTDSVRRYLNEV